jgi:hypothetical protein
MPVSSKIIPFLTGLAIGAAACALVLSQKPPSPGTTQGNPNTAVSSNRPTELEAELAAAKARLKKANADNDKLSARVQEFMQGENNLATLEKPKTRKTGLAAMFGGDGTNGMSEAMSGMMKSVLEQQTDAKLAGMKAKLNLTPEQEKAIREIMAQQMSRGVEMAQKMFKGELSKEEMEKMGKEPMKSEEEQIKALLTPEQIAGYDDYEKEEKVRMARLVANSELMQMQTTLQLTEEQQDKVFAVLAEQAQSQFDPKSTGTNGFDFRHQAETKAEALRGMLTPEQFERYRKFQEQQIKMIEAFMPKDATNSNVHATMVVSP